MSKKILKEIKLINKILKEDSRGKLASDAVQSGKSWLRRFGPGAQDAAKSADARLSKGAKDLDDIRRAKSAEDAFKNLDIPKNIVDDFNDLKKFASDELTPAQKDMLRDVHGVDVRQALTDFQEAVQKGDKAAAETAGRRLRGVLDEASSIKNEGKLSSAGSTKVDPDSGGKTKVEATETAATDGLNLTKEQRQNISYWQSQADRFRKAGDLKNAAIADAKAAEIMGPEFVRVTGVPAKTAEQAAEEIIRKRKIYDEMVKQGIADTPAGRKLLKDIEELQGKSPFLTRAWKTCKKSPWICAGLTALTAYTSYKVAQMLGIIDGPSPSPEPQRGGTSGGYRKCKGSGSAKSCPDNRLEWGCVGDNVRPIQIFLVNCGFPLPKYGVDGRFCSETKGATVAFQSSKGLTPNGVADSQTIDALNKCRQTPTPLEEPEPQATPTPPEEKRVFGFGGDMNESLKRKRYNQIEKLVFERLVKNAS